MIQWTETARRALDEYCARSRLVLSGTGADANEVADDLRRHVEEEVRAANLTVVTEDVIRRILDRVGEPGVVVEPGHAPSTSASDKAAEPETAGFQSTAGKALALIFGVFLPLGTLGFELLTGVSAGVLFDPIPSWFHVIAILLIPAVNLWSWVAIRKKDSRHAMIIGWLNGIAIGVCVYYGLLYLAFFPVAAIGVIYFGLGLIPLTPYLAFIATAVFRARLAQKLRLQLPGGLKAAVLGFGVLAAMQLPSVFTYYGLRMAGAEDKESQIHGIRVLRNFGDRDLVLRACYGMLRSRDTEFDVVRILADGGKPISADHARAVYYRAFGRPFNSVPAPSLYTRTGRWTALEEDFAWDDGLGGEAVAGRVKGLSLLSSRMDAIAEPDAALAYCEWTLEFKNVSVRQREARAQIALPPGAVVSRVTLWIDGEEREAAFGGRSQVRKAYQEVAVAQRRDPILVTTCGPDRILMQCFPVQPNGGVMKVRIGMTAPLVMDSIESGRFIWPRFLERNFRIDSDFRHALWMESSQPIQGGNPAVADAAASNFSKHEDLPEQELFSSPRSVLVRRTNPPEIVWTPHHEGHVIRQTLEPVLATAPSRMVVVIDGSKGMDDFIPDFVEALSAMPPQTEVSILIASDETRVLFDRPQKLTPAIVRDIQQKLRRTTFIGGQDNLPALESAWDTAAAVQNGVVLWIHQPQAALLSPDSGLRQRLERSGGSTPVIEIQTRTGPDRVIERLDGLAVQHVVASDSVRSTLQDQFARWSGRAGGFRFARERVSATENQQGVRVGKHIERLWARDETMRLARRMERDAATRLAASHQLVTPMTGAVVLETQQQFERHGLTPVDATTVPAVPEPGSGALIAAGFALWFYLRRKCAWRRA